MDASNLLGKRVHLTMNRSIFRAIATVFTAMVVFTMNSPVVLAWDQTPPVYDVHQRINREAFNKFMQTLATTDNDKYKGSPIDLEQVYTGPQVKSCGNFIHSYLVDATGALNCRDWLIHGGYSADEPHLQASVKHFYNPVPSAGPQELTDHKAIWNWIGNSFPFNLELESVSAKLWAFTHPGNSFCWRKALLNYKQAMELSDEDKITVVPATDYRDTDIPVGSPAAARNIYLAKAFRGLGETMHMMADVTLPAHVRNDSHPLGNLDPLESTCGVGTFSLVYDSPVEPAIDKMIDASTNAVIMYDEIAKFTNASFYSDDTISDEDSGVEPRNGQEHFPSPQFKHLTPIQAQGTSSTNIPLIYVKYFNGKMVYMIQQTYTGYILKKKEYHVPDSFALDQIRVLLPIAIKANSKLIDLFFPTMELTLEVKEKNYQEFEVTSQMKHLIEKDENWRIQGVGAIQYSGPAELWGEKSGKIADKIQFEKGTLKKQLILYAGKPPAASAATLAADKYPVQDGDKVYIRINAGGRVFKNKPYPIVSSSVQPPLPPSPVQPPQPTPLSFSVTEVTTSVYPPRTLSGYCPKTYQFSGSIDCNGAGTVTYRWEKSDGTTMPVQSLAFTGPGSKNISNTWELSKSGSYWQRIHVLTPNDKISNQATCTVDCKTANFSGKWSAGPFGYMYLAQNGNQVTGRYEHENGTITGTVVGDTMTGTWSEESHGDPRGDSGRVVMSMDMVRDNLFGGQWWYAKSTSETGSPFSGRKVE
jgi:hypothetical protein